MNKRKPRVFVLTEADFLLSGFGNYARQVINRLHATGKYDVAELSCYCKPTDDELINSKWLIYANGATDGNKEEEEHFKKNEINQFGLWRFDRCLLDFQPDFVLSFRDPWMDQFIVESSLREFFYWIWMPTVDSAPQRPYWIEAAVKADAVFTYSEFGEKTLRHQGQDKINLLGCASPAVDKEIFAPVLDKQKHKESFGLPPNSNIVGTVMRNQKRKLFPDLMIAFRQFLDQAPPEIAAKSYLYLHTSYPERNGWDIPELILENKLSSKVFVTYICRACGQVFADLFHDARNYCKRCGQLTSIMPNVSTGASTEDLVKIFNLFDVYVQYAICFAAHQEVLTDRGWIPISEVQVGDYAFTHKGRYKKVLNVWKNLAKSHDKQILDVTLHGTDDIITATENHEFYSLNADDLSCNKKSVRETLGDKIRKKQTIPAPTPKPLSDLKSGDLLAMTIDDTVEDIEEIDLTEFAGPDDLILDSFIEVKGGNTYPRFITVDNEFCRFLGLFAGDGHWEEGVGSKSIRITSHIDEKENHLLSTKLFETVTNRSVKTRLYDDRLGIQHMIYSSIHTEAFKQWFKKHEYKQLPNWTRLLPLKKQKEILIGLFMADGHYLEKRNVSIYATISKTLANQIKDMLHRLRITFNCRLVDRTKDNLRDGKNRRNIYRFEIYGNIKEGEFTSQRRTSSRSVYINNLLFTPIKSIQQSDYTGDVWNLDVEDDHTYTVKKISVINCEGFGIPLLEAAACGIPVMAVDWTAMSDVVRHCKGQPIKVQRVYRELETGADRCYPDNSHLSQLLLKFFQQPQSVRRQKGFQARQGALARYNWDETTNKWENAIDNAVFTGKQGKWDSPAAQIDPNIKVPENLSVPDLVQWAYNYLSMFPDNANMFKGLLNIRDLNFSANFSYGYLEQFDREKFIARLIEQIKHKNVIEKFRTGEIPLQTPFFIEMAHRNLAK